MLYYFILSILFYFISFSFIVVIFLFLFVFPADNRIYLFVCSYIREMMIEK